MYDLDPSKDVFILSTLIDLEEYYVLLSITTTATTATTQRGG